MSVPSLESLLDQHAVKYVEIDDVAVWVRLADEAEVQQ